MIIINTSTETRQILLASFTLSFLVSIQIPIEIFLYNISQMPFNFFEVALYLLPSFLTIFILGLLPIIIPSKFIKKIYIILIITFLLLCWFTANFTFKDYGLFDGGKLNISPLSPSAILEAFIWVGFFTSSIVFNKKLGVYLKKSVKFILLFSLISLTVKLYINIDNIQESVNEKKSKWQSVQELATFSSNSNILHIVLDALQTNTFEKALIEKPKYIDELDGFTFFPNSLANYSRTWLALPALMTGLTHNNHVNTEYPSSALNDNPFWKQLENNNYRIGIHTFPSICKNFFNYCNPIMPSLNIEQIFQLMDYSFFRISPEILKEYIYRNGSWFLIQSDNLLTRGFSFLWRTIITISQSQNQIIIT